MYLYLVHSFKKFIHNTILHGEINIVNCLLVKKVLQILKKEKVNQRSMFDPKKIREVYFHICQIQGH